MRFISNRAPIDLSKKIASVKEGSTGILILLLYICGITVGCVIFISSASLRSCFQAIIMEQYYNALSFLDILLVLSIGSLGCSAILFGAGLCYVGQVCVYTAPMLLGIGTGMSVLSVMNSEEPFSFTKLIIILPVLGAILLCLLLLCEYAAEMTRWIREENESREVDFQKKYLKRYVILTCFIEILIAGQTLLTVFFRHFS